MVNHRFYICRIEECIRCVLRKKNFKERLNSVTDFSVMLSFVSDRLFLVICVVQSTQTFV